MPPSKWNSARWPPGALVGQRDAQAARQVGGLAQALLEDVEVVLDRLEDVGVREPGDRRAGALALGHLVALDQVVARNAAVELLVVEVALDGNLDAQGLRQRVDHRDAHAVQAAGDLVATAVAELAAGVQDGQHDLDGRAAFLLDDADRDAAALVAHGDAVVRVDRDLDQPPKPASASSTELSTAS